MAYIHTIHESDATGELAEWYRRVGNPDGTVDNVMKIHSLKLDTLRTHFEMYRAALHGPSPLSRIEREIIGVVVSRLNGCDYCLIHHSRGLERLLPEARKSIADELAHGRQAHHLTDRETAMIDYASRLTTHPRELCETDVEPLRRAGLTDEALLDLAQVVAYFNYVNRIVLGLGVQCGDGEGPPGQWPDA